MTMAKKPNGLPRQAIVTRSGEPATIDPGEPPAKKPAAKEPAEGADTE
jgi:hypothetical protein